METILNAIKSLIDPKMAARAAETLGESPSKVAKAITLILQAQIARLRDHASTPAIEEVVELAGQKEMLAHLPQIFGGNGVIDHVNVGERMENALMGNDSHAFTDQIAAKSGLKKEHADRLSNWVAAALAAWAGEQVVGKKKPLAALFAAAPAATPPKRKRGHWLLWLILALILIALLLWLLRCCSSCTPKVQEQEQVVVEQVAPPATQIVIDTNFVLPDGTTIVAKSNSLEAQMIRFLSAGGYEKATADELKNQWYHFTQIDFAMGSTSELVSGDMQLRNLALIAKNYPVSKVVIGGYTDHVGSEPINREISRKRAAFIKQYFERLGVQKERISIEGFGEEFATLPEEASDQQRAIDRHIAIRFAK